MVKFWCFSHTSREPVEREYVNGVIPTILVVYFGLTFHVNLTSHNLRIRRNCYSQLGLIRPHCFDQLIASPNTLTKILPSRFLPSPKLLLTNFHFLIKSRQEKLHQPKPVCFRWSEWCWRSQLQVFVLVDMQFS